MVCGRSVIGGTPAVVISFELGFLGGSLGTRTGALIKAAHGHAREYRLPVVSLIATGGSGCRRACSRSPNSSAWRASQR